MANGDDYLGRRQILALCMESPLYFTMTLQKRFNFIKDLEKRSYWSNVSEATGGGINEGGRKSGKE